MWLLKKNSKLLFSVVSAVVDKLVMTITKREMKIMWVIQIAAFLTQWTYNNLNPDHEFNFKINLYNINRGRLSE